MAVNQKYVCALSMTAVSTEPKISRSRCRFPINATAAIRSESAAVISTSCPAARQA